jgi:chromosome segregation ATPase
MNEEINSKIAQKKIAADNIAYKIENMKFSIETKNRAIAKLEADLERQRTSIARMEELAETHAPLEERLLWVRGRIAEMTRDYAWDSTDPAALRLKDTPEYVALIAEGKDLEEQTKDALPTVMSIFYGKA